MVIADVCIEGGGGLKDNQHRPAVHGNLLTTMVNHLTLLAGMSSGCRYVKMDMYYISVNNFQKRLLKLIRSHPLKISDTRKKKNTL